MHKTTYIRRCIKVSTLAARGEDLPIAIAIGNEPIIAVCAAMEILYDQSEYKMAAVLQGSPYPVVKSTKGLDVPWGSQYLLEGRILAHEGNVRLDKGDDPVVEPFPDGFLVDRTEWEFDLGVRRETHQDRNDFQVMLQSQICICQSLRFDSLRGVDH